MKKTISLYFWALTTIVLYSCSDIEPVITLNTRFGEIKLVLFDETPLHKRNLLDLAESGALIVAKGLDEPELIPAEINPKFIHLRGAVAAARQGDQRNPERKSSGSQFYIVDGRNFTKSELTLDTKKLNQLFGQLVRLEKYKDLYKEMAALERAGNSQAIQDKALEYKQVCEKEFGVELDREISPTRLETYTQKGGAPHLDNGYTVFGMVIHGMEVVDQIASQPTNAIDKPDQDVYMNVTIEEIARRDITLRYGYSFPE